MDRENTQVAQLPQEAQMNKLRSFLVNNLQQPQQVTSYPEGISQPQRYINNDFRGGWNTDKADGNLAENELRKADNVDFSERGGLQKREDTSIYEGVFTQQVERVFEWQTSGGQSEIMVLLEDNTLRRVDDPGTIIYELDGSHLDWFVLQEYLYFVDGNSYKRVDDTAFIQEDVPETDASEIIEYGEGFNAELGVAYELEYDNIQEESETVSVFSAPDTTFIKGTHYTIDYLASTITPLDIADDWESGVEYYVDDYVLNAGNSYICINAHTSTEDNEPGEGINWQDFWKQEAVMREDDKYYIEYEYEYEGNVDISPIRGCMFVARHNKSYRIFAARDTAGDRAAIYYSEKNDPGNFKATSVLHPTTNDGPVQGLEVLDDMLLVFYKNSIWAWRGIDPDRDAVWEKLPVRRGTFTNRAIETGIGALTFLDNNGIYAISPQKGTENITDNKVSQEVKNIGNRLNTHSVFDSSNNRLLLAYSKTPGRCDSILVFDWELGAFARWTGLGDINDFCYTKDGDLLMATDGAIKRMNQGYGTNNIELDIETRPLYLGNLHDYKLVSRLFSSLSNFTNSTEVTLDIDSDIDKKQNIDVSSQIDGVIVRHNLFERGVEFNISITDNSNENVVVYNIGLAYRPIMTYQEGLLNANS